MILEATATDVEIEYHGETLLFHDVKFTARLCVTHHALSQQGPFEYPGEPDDFQVVSISTDGMWHIFEGIHSQVPTHLMRFWNEANDFEVINLIKESLTDRIHAGEWDDEIRNG